MIIKIRYLFFITLFFIGFGFINVNATSLSFSNARVGFSSIQYSNAYGYNYSPYTEHISNNTSYTTTTSNGYTFLTRARFYVYVDSSHTLQTTRQYTFNYKICTAWTEFNGYFSSANIKLLNVMKSTGTTITDAVSEEASSVSLYRTAVSGSPNCSNLIITYRPTTNNLRTVGFWVSFLDFVPNTNTCYVSDCGNVGYNSFSGELLQTFDGSYGNDGYFKYTLTASYEDSSGNAIIEQNTQTIINQQNNINNSINNINNSINDDDTEDEASDFADFLNSFSSDTHGLTGIITAPLSAIQSLTSATCQPLVLPLPFLNTNLTLPCMRPIYDSTLGSFMQIYDVITFGIVAYWVCVRIFTMVKDFKNPEHDEIEVMDL